MTRQIGKTGPAADPAQQNLLRKKEKLEDINQKTDLKAVLSTESGRRVMARVIEMCGVDDSRVARTADGAFDPAGSLYYVGERGIGTAIIEACRTADLEGYLKMYCETLRDEKKRAALEKELASVSSEENEDAS